MITASIWCHIKSSFCGLFLQCINTTARVNHALQIQRVISLSQLSVKSNLISSTLNFHCQSGQKNSYKSSSVQRTHLDFFVCYQYYPRLSVDLTPVFCYDWLVCLSTSVLVNWIDTLNWELFKVNVMHSYFPSHDIFLFSLVQLHCPMKVT